MNQSELKTTLKPWILSPNWNTSLNDLYFYKALHDFFSKSEKGINNLNFQEAIEELVTELHGDGSQYKNEIQEYVEKAHHINDYLQETK